MKIFEYIKSLIPSFATKRVLEQLGASQQQLNETVIPSVENVARTIGNNKFNSRGAQTLDAYAKKNLDVKYSGNFVNGVLIALKQANENVPVIRKAAEQAFATEVTKESLNIVRTNILQHVDVLDFITIYSGRLLTYIFNNESVAKPSKDKSFTGALVRTTPAELDYVTENFEAFIAALNTISMKKDVLEKGIKSLPAINISESNAENIEVIAGLDKIDPFGFSKIGFIPNPFFVIAIRTAERQDARFRTINEEITRLNFQIRGWEMQQANTVSAEEKAQFAKFIDHTRGRIIDFQDELDTLERK